jgi:hypothetical protein
MSAPGFLFATEAVVDAFEAQLDKAYGKGKWQINGDKYTEHWGTPPKSMKLEVTNRGGDTLGHIEVTNKYDEEAGHDDEPFLTAIPDKVNCFDASGKRIDLFPKKAKVTVTVEMEIEYSDELTEQEAIDVASQEMDYDFSYNSDNVRIVKTEITDTNE